jgi:hypothetical protein
MQTRSTDERATHNNSNKLDMYNQSCARDEERVRALLACMHKYL